MRNILIRHLPHPWPDIVMAAWYLAVVWAILLRTNIEDPPFRYLGM